MRLDGQFGPGTRPNRLNYSHPAVSLRLAGAAREFHRHFTRAAGFDFIKRAIGNNVGHAGRVAQAKIVRCLP
jgi:hypothetical protein